MNTYVYAVHSVHSDEISPTKVIYRDEAKAMEYAEWSSRYRDFAGVLASCVVRHTLDEEGTHMPIAMFVRGVRQELPHITNDRRLHCSGADRSSYRIR